MVRKALDCTILLKNCFFFNLGDSLTPYLPQIFHFGCSRKEAGSTSACLSLICQTVGNGRLDWLLHSRNI